MSDEPRRDYFKEMERLAVGVSASDTAEANKLLERQGARLQTLTHAFLCLRYLIERGDLASAPEGIQVLYGKMVEGVGAILFLLGRGLPGPAAQIFRSALETSVHLQVILRDVEAVKERVLLFEEFLLVQRFERRFGPGVTAEQREKAEKEFERIRANYHPTHPYSWAWKVCPSKRVRKKNVPDNPNLKDLCVFIDHLDYHETLYGHLSDTSHPVPGYRLWLRRDDQFMHVGPKASVHIPMLVRLTVAFSMDTLLRMLDFLKPSDAGALRVFFANALMQPDPDDEQVEAP